MYDETTQAADGAATTDANERDVADVTAADPRDTVPVQLVSGTVQVPAPAEQLVGGEVKSDLHCPLLVDEADKVTTTVVERYSNAAGEDQGRVVHRVPEQVVVDPVKCPSCSKVVERHMLVFNVETGERDCPIAVQRSKRKDYIRQFGADAEAGADRTIAAQDGSTGPAAAGNDATTARTRVASADLPSENLRDEAKRDDALTEGTGQEGVDEQSVPSATTDVGAGVEPQPGYTEQG